MLKNRKWKSPWTEETSTTDDPAPPSWRAPVGG